MERILGGILAYKNVRVRMIKLRNLGLIEEIKEKKRYRKAIKYKVTTMGLFQNILNNPLSTLFPDLLLHKNNILIQTFLYQFFEPESIEKFREYHCTSYLDKYIRRCCELILDAIESNRLVEKRGGRTLNLPDSYIGNLAEEEVKRLILTIVTISKDVIDDPDTPDLKSIFPIETLIKDKKFMPILEKMKKDFDDGYQRFQSVIS